MADFLATAIQHATGIRILDDRAQPVGGGSIHEARRYQSEHGSLFVKVGARSAAAMFEAEAVGLRTLATADAVRVPQVLGSGCTPDRAFLCLEWFDLSGATRGADKQLGEQLALLHRSHAAMHGAHSDNFIGSTPQSNRSHAHWPEFFRNQRLQVQLDLARTNGADAETLDRGQRLADSLHLFFTDYQPIPSLLHGDLWGGNAGVLATSEPVLFDPAVYYGDRETDLAMTRLFGGFGREFYAAYESVWSLDAGASTRQPLYQLYHVLNHFNLFGGSYLAQARGLMERLLAELRR